MFNNLHILIITFLLSCLSLYGNNGTPQEEYQIHINRTNEKIVVDGLLNEATWQKSEIASDFWMSFPVDDKKAELKTEVQVTYDDNFLYVAAKCYDPNGYIIQTLKRDANFWSGDGFAFVVDPVNLKTSGFLFGVNPYGVQMEALVTGNTGRRGGRGSGMNDEWDNKWYSKTTRANDHWIAEIAIPFKTLRYEDSKDIWGINFIRSEMSDNSFHTWSHVPVQFRSVDLNYTGGLIWDEAPSRKKGNVAVIPYTSGGVFSDYEVEPTDTDTDFNVGVDAKIAVTSSLNLDVTINPDFSQVEVDEQVTNLSRFNVRLPEKRLFFLENSDIFSDFGNSPARPFFSRKIGLDGDGNSIPILYGLRLTGNATKNLRMGLLNMHTRSTDDFLAQNYSAAAVRYRVLDRSVVKAFVLNRQSVDGTEFQSNDYGRNAGLEFNYYSKDNQWQAWTGYNHSFKPGITDKNYYYKAGIRRQGRNFSGIINWYQVQQNYYLDMGFLDRISHYDVVQDTSYRVGYGSLFMDFEYQIYPKKKGNITSQSFSIFNWITPQADEKNIIARRTSASYSLNFRGRSRFRLNLANELNELLYPFTFTSGESDEPLPAQSYITNVLRLNYRSDQRKPFFYDLEFTYGGFYSGTRTGIEAELNYRVQPWGNFGLKLAYNDLQFGGPYGERELYSFSPKIEINFSNNLFWTTFIQYNTQAENFNINSRLQWRFAPMSDIYLVYTDNYLVETDEMMDRFKIQNFGPKNRAIVFKVNYWLTL